MVPEVLAGVAAVDNRDWADNRPAVVDNAVAGHRRFREGHRENFACLPLELYWCRHCHFVEELLGCVSFFSFNVIFWSERKEGHTYNTVTARTSILFHGNLLRLASYRSY